tara:strand:+ start:8449 stop:9501 length:1053 start_codon:yes stop_codon:yes gene_type:complete
MNKDLTKRLKQIQLHESATIESSIKNLIKSGEQIIIVIDKNKKVVGTITDGDLRNFIIKKINNLNLPIKKIMNSNPILLNKKNFHLESVKVYMSKKKISHLPIINDKKRLIDFISYKDFLKLDLLENVFVIMAGGQGTRLLPYTKNTPKPLIKIDDKPIIIHLIEKARSIGFKNFVITTGYKKNKIIKYLKNSRSLNVNIKYIKETKPLGTAGSLVYLKKQKKPIIVCNGDIMSNIDFKDFLNYHKTNKAFITVASKNHDMQNPFGVIKLKKKIINQISEKPNYSSLINIGAYVINPSVLKSIKKPKFLTMVDFINNAIKNKKKVIPYITGEFWYDIGTPEDLKKIKKNK